MEIEITSDTTLLEKLMNNIEKGVNVKVGIFDSEVASYAQKLEFGANNQYVPEIDKFVNIPPRSFLQMPLANEFYKEIKGQIKSDDLLNNMDLVGADIGEICIDIIQSYMQNEGYGEWAENLPAWKAYKQEHGYDDRILHKTGRLEDSIEYRIE